MMEMIKSMIKHYYPLLIMFSCVSFVIWMFFSNGLHGKKNVFAGAGGIFAAALDSGELKNDGISYMENVVSGYVPVITYTSGTQTSGEYMTFKNLFDVILEDGRIVNGNTENGFTIYLEDIKNLAGDSVLMNLTAEEIVGIEEIPAAFVYEKEQDILYCFASGIYTVYLKIYGADGSVETYVFQLPVEAG